MRRKIRVCTSNREEHHTNEQQTAAPARREIDTSVGYDLFSAGVCLSAAVSSLSLYLLMRAPTQPAELARDPTLEKSSR